MNLTLDIEGKVNRIQKELDPSLIMAIFSVALKFIGLEELLLKRRLKQQCQKMVQQMDEFILTLEGFQRHIAEFDKEDATHMLLHTKKAIRDFDKLDEKYARFDYIQNSRLKERIKYTLKTLYKTEALLHVAATKDMPVMPTPDYIRDGLARMSQEAISQASQG